MSFINQVKELFKDSLVYGLGNAIGRFIGIFTAPILTRILVPSDYGVMALLQTIVGFLIMLAGFNLNSGVYFYYFDRDDPKERPVILSTSFVFYLTFGLLFSAAAWIGAPVLERILLIRQPGIEEAIHYDYVKYIRILAVGIVFSMMDTNFRSLLRMTRQPHKYMALNILQVLTNFTLVILLVVCLKLGIEGALWAGVITSIIVCLVGFFMVVGHYALAFSFSFLALFLSYSLPAFPSVFLNWGLSQSNRFFLNYYAPLDQQGYYSIASKIATVFVLFTTAFRLAWDPFALSIMKNNNAATTYSRAYTFYTVGFGLLGGCIALLARPALSILTPVSYHVAYSMVFILVGAYLYQGANNVLGIGIAISKRTKYISYAQVVTFTVNILLNFLLIPYFSAWGAALAFAGGVIAQSLAYYYFAQRLYPIPYQFWRLQIFVLMLFSIIAIEAYIIRDLNFWHSTLTATLFVPVLGFLAWRLGLRPEERRETVDLMMPVWKFLRLASRKLDSHG